MLGLFAISILFPLCLKEDVNIISKVINILIELVNLKEPTHDNLQKNNIRFLYLQNIFLGGLMEYMGPKINSRDPGVMVACNFVTIIICSVIP